MKIGKGLEFRVVAQASMGHMPPPGEDENEAARLFYVAAKLAAQGFVTGTGGLAGVCSGNVSILTFICLQDGI